MSLTSDLLAPGGGLARAIPHYEDRAEQRAMSAAVARALAPDGGRPLIVEAGTGTGKTLAYLIPALQSGKRDVVSTGRIGMWTNPFLWPSFSFVPRTSF